MAADAAEKGHAMSTIRWGILGSGGIAHSFTRDLLLDGHSVAAVGSRSLESAERFAAEFGIATAHGSYAELVAEDSVDIVYVASPHSHHAEHAELALRAGKPVLIEKAFTINAAEARRIVALAEERGLLVLEAMWTRWLPHMAFVHEVIASGRIGEVRTLVADHAQLLPSDPSHRLNDPALGGGALLDLGIYPVSFAWDVLGAPTRIHATATFTETGVDRQSSMIFEYASGATALLTCELDAPGPNRAVVVGTRGRIELDRTWYAPTTVTVFDERNAVADRFERAVEGTGLYFEAREAERLIASGATSSDRLTPAQSIAIMESLDEIRRQTGVRYPGE